MGLLYEVELESDFEFDSKNLYLSKKSFKAVAKLNDVNLKDEKLDDCMAVWRLFYIALKKYDEFLAADFKDHIICFEKVTKLLDSNSQSNSIDIRKYKKFFKYLIKMHYEFKKQQHYKLMWNLESIYIKKVIKLLLGKGIQFSVLNRLAKIDQRSYLYTIYKGNDVEYFKSHADCFLRGELLSFLQNKYSLEKEDVFKLLFGNRDYYPTLHTIIELHRRHRESIFNEYLLIALIRSIALNIENLIRQSIGEYCKKTNEKNRYIIENIRKEKHIEKVTKNKLRIFQFDLYDYLRQLSTNGKLDILKKQFDDIEFHKRFEGLQYEPISKDKYFFILLKTRNHVAHGSVDLNKFFKNGASNLSDVLDSVVFIFVYLEYLKDRLQYTKSHIVK